MAINYPEELKTMREDAERLHSLAICVATVVTEMREHLDDLLSRAMPASCRHEIPIGDYCAYCNETPEG
ncbi:MAG: hypothetical protein RIT19_215 [Verrucomicrobiota bacterium]|jgi:hypothetical protein